MIEKNQRTVEGLVFLPASLKHGVAGMRAAFQTPTPPSLPEEG